jgi:hypothetical protein
MFSKFLLTLLLTLNYAWVCGQLSTTDTSFFKDKNGLIISINPDINKIGNLSGELIREQFDSKLFNLDFDSTYSLSIDSIFLSGNYYTIVMTLTKVTYDPLRVSWFRVYHVSANWIKPKRKKRLRFYDYGYEF